ncbi:MAG: hypothetical protein MSQ05_03525 [Akkermansia sp.]|nr:hypothetical protein [Akkermansia sp.]
MPPGRSTHHSRIAVSIHLVDCRTCRQQQLDGLCVALCRSLHQRRFSVFVLVVDICTLAKQFLESFNIADFCGIM